MSDSRVRSGAESIGGPGAYSHANVPGTGESGRKQNLFEDRSAAKANPSARIHYSCIDTDTGAHENGADHNPVTRASAYSTLSAGEENRANVALKAIEYGHKRACKDNNEGTKRGKTRQSHQADDSSGIPLADSYSSGKYTIVSSRNEASNASDEEPISSFETRDSYNMSEETSDDEQVVCKDSKRFCSERGSQFLSSGEPSSEKFGVRPKLPMLEFKRKRDTSEFDSGPICLPLSGSKSPKENSSPDQSTTYIESSSTQCVELQKSSNVPVRVARKDLSISESGNPSNHNSSQDLDSCAATFQSQNGFRVDGVSRAQRKNDDLHSPSESCADETAPRLQSTSANTVEHNSNASNHEKSTQPAIGRSFVVDLVCRMCSKTCVSLSQLTIHMRSHTGEKPFACAECEKRFSGKGGLTVHMRTHTGEKPYACAECDMRFSQKGNLARHMTSHTGEKPFACVECDKRYSQSGHLADHMRSHTGEKPFACAKCDKTFLRNGDLTVHMRSHTGEKPFACAECHKRFLRSSHLASHRRSHTGEKPFACVECDKRFSHSSHLASHRRSHTGEKPFACAECDKTFSRNGDLTVHMRSHTGEKPFACAECDKTFLRNGDLTVHMRTHTGEKPFACAECDKRFSHSSYLASHRRSHTGEKPFACVECDKRYSQSGQLAVHMRSHTGEKPFACAECEKRFSRKGRLTVHMRTHTGEKPFACAECDKRFSRSSSLATHMKSHTGEKPFACAECDKRLLHFLFKVLQ